MTDQEESKTDVAYRVLARKYRPDNFDALIGQSAMVRTLSNAIDAGRLAHAFILTGVRGVGKTTTARIIAKALNCIGHDGPTISPCGTCSECVSIAESRHVDVMEMDAASRTGVDDIREIIDGVRYAPQSARYKIYIIDEVHMLSKNAFNALLKTLEEPPEHVKFIFATTEIRKLPVTVLSRCQRFDLKRVEAEELVAHMAAIVDKEDCTAEEAALKLIARAAEGSVRDALSLLDQAIAHGAGTIDENQVREMLGLADRAQVLDLFETVMKGDIAAAITTLRGQYDLGADPSVVLQDMLDVTHWLTRLKVTPDTGNDALVSEAEKTQGGAMAKTLGMPHLTLAWQMLLKGLKEVREAPSPISAAEMVLIRLAYAMELPAPADLVKALKNKPAAPTTTGAATAPTGGAVGGPTAAAEGSNTTHISASHRKLESAVEHAGATVLAMKQSDDGDHADHPMPITFEAMVDLFKTEKMGQIAMALTDRVKVVSYRPGAIEINPENNRLPATFMMDMKQALKGWTGQDWLISLSNEVGGESLKKVQKKREDALKDEALEDPMVAALVETFPEAKIVQVRERKNDDLDTTLDEEAMAVAAKAEADDFEF